MAALGDDASRGRAGTHLVVTGSTNHREHESYGTGDCYVESTKVSLPILHASFRNGRGSKTSELAEKMKRKARYDGVLQRRESYHTSNRDASSVVSRIVHQRDKTVWSDAEAVRRGIIDRNVDDVATPLPGGRPLCGRQIAAGFEVHEMEVHELPRPVLLVGQASLLPAPMGR